VSGNEHGGDLASAPAQLPEQLGTAQAGHGDIEQEAGGPALIGAGEKGFRRRVGLHREPELAEQVGERFSDRLVIIDDCDERNGGRVDDPSRLSRT
jgi:hypothetical protein